MRYLRPEFVGWWLVVPVVIACWTARVQYLRAMRRRAPVAPRFASLSRRSGPARDVGVLVAGALATGALVFALARPQVLTAGREAQVERQDLVLVLDRSASMRAHDVAPSRFSRAVLEIKNVLARKPDAIGRVGLVGFADAAVILSFLTHDLESVQFFLDWADQDRETLLGTDLGAALQSAREVAAKDDRNTRKLFVLVSDGEDYGAELARQVDQLRREGTRVHCIGIGSDRAQPVPVLQRDGREAPLRDEDGAIVETTFDETTLRTIAAATGGRYVRSRTGTEFAAALEDIVRGERRVLGWHVTTAYRDVYPYGLAVAGVAAFALWVLL